jgi:hypothetical protein
MSVIDKFTEYRKERKYIKEVLSPDNRSFC